MFVTKSAYDALQRECDRWATMYETASQRTADAERENASLRVALASQQAVTDIIRQTHELGQKQYARLLKMYHALRMQGAQPRPAEQTTPVAAPTSDIDLVYNTQRQMAVDSAYEDFLARGLAPEEARAEAQRAVDSIFAPIAGEFQ